jgi:hypothetical protein
LCFSYDILITIYRGEYRPVLPQGYLDDHLLYGEEGEEEEGLGKHGLPNINMEFEKLMQQAMKRQTASNE